MAYSNIKTPADGSTSTFSVPFPYLNKDHVHVFIDGVETFDFTWVTEATINLNTIPPAGSIVTIQRITPKNERNVDFQNGSALNPDNLDLDSNQLLYIMQENSDKADESLRIDTDNKWDAGGRVIKNVGDPVDDEDFLNKGVADQFLASVRASEQAAKTSETNAKASELAAKVSEDNAYIYSKIAQDNALIIASSQLAQAISAADTSLTVLDGSDFPDAPFVVSIEDEIIEVGSKSGNTFSALVRGLEGTTPASHDSGVRVENRFTAGTYQQVVNEIDTHKADYVHVDSFGAVGDGSTDDTKSIEKAINSISSTGFLSFRAGAKYKISNTLQIDVSKIKGVIGNNASLITETDIVVLEVFGTLTTGTATPSDQNTQSEKNNLGVFIRDLKIHSNSSTNSVGVGIKMRNLFGLKIESCSIYELRKGIEIVDRNRNIIITNNHIWNCKEYCVHYFKADVHQSIINNNHISYGRTVIYFENGDVHNIQIVGNNLEGGYSQNSNHNSVIKFLCNTINSQISQIQISGNSIEEHFKSTEGLIRLEREFYDNTELLEGENAPYLGVWEIVANEISGSDIGIYVRSGLEGVITGNVFKNLKDYAIKGYEALQNIVISGNSFSGNNDNAYLGGVLEVTAGSEKIVGEVSNFIFSDNMASYVTKNAVVFKKNPIVSSFTIFESTFNNNVINYSRYVNQPEFTQLEGFTFDVDATNIISLNIVGNMLRPRNANEHGMRVNASTADNMIIKNNMIRGLIDRNGVAPTYYTFPTSTTSIIADNIPVQ